MSKSYSDKLLFVVFCYVVFFAVVAFLKMVCAIGKAFF